MTPTLNAALPAHFYCCVRREYLRDLEDGVGEFEEAAVFGVASVPNRAVGFHVHLKSGGVYWRLPVSALCVGEHEEHLSLEALEAWDAFGYQAAVTSFPYLRERGCSVRLLEGVRWQWHPGTYAGVTIDWIENGYSDAPDQQKCLHLIRLDCGCFALQPNDRVLWADQSFVVAPESGVPDYKRSTHVFWSEG